jgi:hypothetical protein
VCAILTSHFQPEICEEAANGEQAIAKALALQPDLILHQRREGLECKVRGKGLSRRIVGRSGQNFTYFR